MQHDALADWGGVPGATQIQRDFGVPVEDHQVADRYLWRGRVHQHPVNTTNTSDQ